MISRFVLGVGLIGLMLVASFGTYTYLGGRQSKVAVVAQKPPSGPPKEHAYILPGTLYLAQGGAIYSLSGGRFHQLTNQDGWTQPALYPDRSYLLAVHRTDDHSDVFVLGRFGQAVEQLTNNAAPGADNSARHWSFYPHMSIDENSFFMSYDEPKFGYDVPFSIWAVGMAGGGRQLWTNSNDYTGGDIEPIPLRTGGIMFTKFNYGPDGNLIGQLWLTTRASPGPSGVDGKALTSPEDDCSEPSISPDGTRVAMICTHEKQVADLVIAAWNGSYLGTLQTVISDQLVAQPTWAPDGSGIAYLAPAAGSSNFQLWFLPKERYNPPSPSPIPVPTPTPGGPYHGPAPSPTLAPPVVVPLVKPIQLTTSSGFDATSPMTWAG
jgi:hypothetical protein